MRQLADGVHQIRLTPRDGVNAYLLGDVLVDAGTPQLAKRLLGQLAGHTVRAHALTHAHLDHAGGSRAVADALAVPVWVGALDAADLESGKPVVAETPLRPVVRRFANYPGTPVARQLREGDDLGHGFTVLEVPGHSAGHVAYWRESDRVLVAGDVWFNLHLATLRPGLREPPRIFTPDPARNRASERRLAALEPELVLFGHGPPLRDPAKLREFTASLPRD
jgi:glyoxylase-like metal-dependent hydrolase (beta-lactamase superfamily II)